MFTLGDKPRDRSRQAREWLDAHVYDDTLSYARATVIRVLEETGPLTHLNPGGHVLAGLPEPQPACPRCAGRSCERSEPAAEQIIERLAEDGEDRDAQQRLPVQRPGVRGS